MNIFKLFSYSVLAATSISASQATALDLSRPDISWPFGEYRTCFGNSAREVIEGPAKDLAQERMQSVGQSDRAIFTRANWSRVITAEQYIAAFEYTIEQCKLRSLGEEFDNSCPIAVLPIDDAVIQVGADTDAFWRSPSKTHRDLKDSQQNRYDALSDLLVQECGK